VRLVQVRADPARVRWTWEREGWPFLAELDAAQMEHVLINVLKNAVEALPPGGGTVTVRAVSAPGGAFVEIEDSGPGISQETRPHLFTPFFTTKQNGHGIGLTMVQEILLHHGFAYSLDGPPGGPTRFRIDLGCHPESG
jgi:signal transduction histidine kinase